MRSASIMAAEMFCSTTRMVCPASASVRQVASRSRTMIGASPSNGSSSSRSFGSRTSARAIASMQPISIADYVVQLVDEQRRKWKEPDGGAFPESLDGLFGGDGDGPGSLVLRAHDRE